MSIKLYFSKTGVIFALIVSNLTISSSAQAVSIIGNNPPIGNDGADFNLAVNDTFAWGFTTPNNSVDYPLNNVTLRFSNYISSVDNPILRIYADTSNSSTSPIGTDLQSVTFTNPTSVSNNVSNFDFLPNSQFTFNANTRYWLTLFANSSSFALRANNPNQAPTSSFGITFNGARSSADGQNYLNSPITHSFRLDNTTPIPFGFNPVGGVALLGGLWTGQRLLKTKKA